MPTIRLCHATCREFDAFSDSSVGRGGDPNSALGVHLAGCLADTLRYVRHANWTKGYKAGAAALVVEAEISRALVAFSSNDFFGTDETGAYDRDAGDFTAARASFTAPFMGRSAR